MKSKILLIVEGELTEPKILGNANHGLLSLIGTDYEIVPFANPIYELYEAYKQNEYDDITAYLRIEKGLKIDNDIISKKAFSSIYLIFDFEPHYHKYSDQVIKDMLLTFNNETELGKLYINYPMVEAYYDLKSLPDKDYETRTVSLEDFNGKKYKKEVNTTTVLKKNMISRKDLCYIIYHNYNKAKKLLETNDYLIDYDRILSRQIDYKNKYNKIYVLCTFALLPIDYNYEKTMEIIKEELN